MDFDTETHPTAFFEHNATIHPDSTYRYPPPSQPSYSTSHPHHQHLLPDAKNYRAQLRNARLPERWIPIECIGTQEHVWRKAGTPRQWMPLGCHGLSWEGGGLWPRERRPDVAEDQRQWDSYGGERYMLSGALGAQDIRMRQIPHGEIGITSPEIMVNRQGMGTDPFERLDPFEHSTEQMQVQTEPLSTLHTSDRSAQETASSYHLCAAFPPPSFIGPSSTPEPLFPPFATPPIFHLPPAQSPPARHIRLTTPPAQPHSASPTSEAQGLESLLSFIHVALRKLGRKRLLIRRERAILQQQHEKAKYERSKLRAEKRRWTDWVERTREVEQDYSERRRHVRRMEHGNWYGRDQPGCTQYADECPCNECGWDYEYEGDAVDFEFDRPYSPPPSPNTPDSHGSCRRESSTCAFAPLEQTAQLQLVAYNKAWTETPHAATGDLLPWPSEDSSAAALDHPALVSELRYWDIDVQPDKSTCQEWNVFCFFTLAFGLRPVCTTGTSGRLKFTVYSQTDGNEVGTFEGRLVGRKRPFDLQGLKKQLKMLESVRWHPDMLAKREMSDEERERAKDVYQGVTMTRDAAEEYERIWKGGFGVGYVEDM